MPAGAGEGRAGAPPCVSSVRITLPSLTLSPCLILSSFTTPADGAGTSIVALSDSSVTSGSSAFTVSPGLTKTSMIGTSLKSPMSGTLTVATLGAPAVEAGAGADVRGLCAAVAGLSRFGAAVASRGGDADAGFAASAAPDSRVSSTVPSLTLSPSFTRKSFTVPAAGAGTSIVALSDSSVTSESSAFTVSPGLTNTSMIGTSLKSPISGTLTSMVLIGVFLFRRARRSSHRSGASRERCLKMRQTVHGCGFAASIPYLVIASATLTAGRAASSASAFKAATVT